MSKLVNYGGNGFAGVSEKGKFEIRSKKDDHYIFSLFSEAKQYYDSISGEKVFWDLTHGVELLDGFIEYDGKASEPSFLN